MWLIRRTQIATQFLSHTSANDTPVRACIQRGPYRFPLHPEGQNIKGLLRPCDRVTLAQAPTLLPFSFRLMRTLFADVALLAALVAGHRSARAPI